MAESLRAAIQEAVELALADGEALQCTRVWEAWQYNTMHDDDFVDASDGPLGAEITDAVLEVIKSYALGLDAQETPENPYD